MTVFMVIYSDQTQLETQDVTLSFQCPSVQNRACAMKFSVHVCGREGGRTSCKKPHVLFRVCL